MDNFQKEINKELLSQAKGLVNEFATRVRLSRRGPSKQKTSSAARDELAEKCKQARQQQIGRPLTKKERDDIDKYVDRKIASRGNGATANDIDPNEKNEMANFCASAQKDQLADVAQTSRQVAGPVAEAQQAIPDVTVPKEVPKPEPPELPEYPPEPDYDSMETETEKAAAKAEHDKQMQNVKAERRRLNDEYWQAMDEYNEKVAAEEEKAKKIEAAIATGAVVVDRDPDSKDENGNPLPYVIKYVDGTGEWKQLAFKDSKDAKEKLGELVTGTMTVVEEKPKLDENGEPIPVLDKDGKPVQDEHGKPVYETEPVTTYDGPIIPEAFTTPLSDDVLAAIATGDVILRPSRDGKTIESLVKEVPGVLDGDGKWHTDAPQDAINKIKELTVNYQKNSKVTYADIDGKWTEEQKKTELEAAAYKASTDPEGLARCPVCGQQWPAAQALVKSPEPEPTPLADAAPQTAGLLQSSYNQYTIVPTNPTTRRAIIRDKSKRYQTGYSDWYRVNATKALMNTVFQYHQHIYTSEEVETLCNQVRITLDGNSRLIASYVEQLEGDYAISSNPIRRANIFAIKKGLLNSRNVIKELSVLVRMSPRAKVCPLCGQDVADDDPLIIPEAAKAETSFKGGTEAGVYGTTIMETPFMVAEGWAEFFRDGSQQGINPFASQKGGWTKYSFRPADSMEKYPVIGIAPSSFQSILSFPYVLNTTPYVIISEYFMRNNIANAISLFQSISNSVAKQSDSKQESTAAKIKNGALELLNKVAQMIGDIGAPEMMIDIPFILYHRLKGKVYGNRYVFPYIPKGNSITSSNNDSEWGSNTGITAKLMSGLNNLLNGAVGAVGVGVAKAFPAPTWTLPEQGNKWSMKFTLNLINDEYIRARCNYMCANTIINNNRWIQKTIIGFPGALYEIILPTGVRELMCTGGFTLTSIGVPRHAPPKFFTSPFVIGSEAITAPKVAPMHSDSYEVIPDAYQLDCQLTSALQENLNNSIFAYYLNIASFAPGTETNSAADEIAQYFLDGKAPKQGEGLWASAAEAKISASTTTQGAQEIVDSIGALVTQAVGKAEAPEDKEDSEDKDGEDKPPEDEDDPAPEGVSMQKREAEVPDREHIRRLYTDTHTDIYQKKYNALNKELSELKRDIRKKSQDLNVIKQRQIDCNIGSMRKVYIKKMKKLQSEISALLTRQDDIWGQMVDLEIEIYRHAKQEMEERVHARAIPVPSSYFDLPEMDEVEKIKLRFMTRKERAEYIAEKDREIAKHDKWGVSACPDFLLRCCVAKYIMDLVIELESLIRDVEETDTKAYDEYMYRKDMLWEDFNVVMNPKIPFVLNRTNLVYVPYENIPDEFKPKQQDPDGGLDSGDSNDDSESTDIVPVDQNSNVPYLPVNVDDPVDREAIIKAHRAEVIRLKFGGEDGLIQAAYNYALEYNDDAKACRWALVYLKGSPEVELDGEGDNKGKIKVHFRKLVDNWAETIEQHPTWTNETKTYINRCIDCDEMVSENSNRTEAISTLTVYLYRIVGSSQQVLEQNAMIGVETEGYTKMLADAAVNQVDSVAKKAVSELTNEFHR